MKLNKLKKILAGSALGVAALLGTTGVANAQWSRQERQQQRYERQQQRVYTQRQMIEQQRILLAQQRQREEQLRLQNMRNRNGYRTYERTYGNVYGTQSNRGYRVYRNGSYYQTDQRGINLLQQAVNNGYQQGVRAGQADRANRRRGSYNNYSIYQNGNFGYQSYVDSSQYRYYFQQGFERGYQDGYNSRYQYGTNNNGSFNILGTILQQVLNFSQF
jgi:hypothetical protein